MARNEFKPPSDFVADNGGGGGKKNIWKWVGIGCGAIVLIVGIAMALGAWKTVSCCSDAIDSARRGVEAGKFANQVGAELAAGKFDEVHAKMSEGLAAEMSVDELRNQAQTYQRFFNESTGRVSNVNVQKDDLEAPARWNMTLEFAPPSSGEKLVVPLVILSEGEEKNQHFVIDALSFEQRERDMRSEPPAREVLDFHHMLRRGDYEKAYQAMSPEFSKQADMGAFKKFVEQQKPVFRSGDVEIQSVAYGQQTAQVVAVLSGEGGERARVEYELTRLPGPMRQWRVAAVTPTYEEGAAAEQPNAGQPDAGSPDEAKDAELGDKAAEQGDKAGEDEADQPPAETK